MSKAATAQPQGGSYIGSVLAGWPALLLSVIVLIAAVYAFSPRPQPPFPETHVRPERLLVNGLARQDARWIAAGELGQILIADDPNGPWRSATVEPQRGSTFTQVIFVAKDVAIAVGHDGWIVRSEDNGQTWKEAAWNGPAPEPAPSAAPADGPPPDLDTPPPLPPDPFLGIAGPYDGKLFAFGGFGLMMTSTDLGKTWERVTDPALGDGHLNGMTRAADRSLLLVGERGAMLRSTDLGQTWALLPQVYTGSFYGVMTLPDALLAYGMRGNVFRSDDDGQSWKKIPLSIQTSIHGGAVTAGGKVVLVGEGNRVFTSDDAGKTFTLVAEGRLQRMSTVRPIGESEWLTAGESGIRLIKPSQAPQQGAQP